MSTHTERSDGVAQEGNTLIAFVNSQFYPLHRFSYDVERDKFQTQSAVSTHSVTPSVSRVSFTLISKKHINPLQQRTRLFVFTPEHTARFENTVITGYDYEMEDIIQISGTAESVHVRDRKV